MRTLRIPLRTLVFVVSLIVAASPALASPFVVFPKASELISPDGRFAVRSVDAAGAASDFVGTFHSLWLFELSTGRSRKLCDYLGVASAAWSDHGFLVVTQYVGKRTSRALVFSALTPVDPVMIDKATLIQLLPTELRPALRDNDHVFVEGSRVEQDSLHLSVWGYGQRDPNGFRYHCEYALREGSISCSEERTSHETAPARQ
jgi:hypothetical protein